MALLLLDTTNGERCLFYPGPQEYWARQRYRGAPAIQLVDVPVAKVPDVLASAEREGDSIMVFGNP